MWLWMRIGASPDTMYDDFTVRRHAQTSLTTTLAGVMDLPTLLEQVASEVKSTGQAARRVANEDMPAIRQQVEAIRSYVPWLIGALGFLGAAILISAWTTAQR